MPQETHQRLQRPNIPPEAHQCLPKPKHDLMGHLCRYRGSELEMLITGTNFVIPKLYQNVGDQVVSNISSKNDLNVLITGTNYPIPEFYPLNGNQPVCDM